MVLLPTPSFPFLNFVHLLLFLSALGLGILELIHCIVETLDNYFQNVCELDIMCVASPCSKCGVMKYLLVLLLATDFFCRYNLEKAHFIVDEMICNGFITETNRCALVSHQLMIRCFVVVKPKPLA
jgi:AP-4 complex subunit sigma-1